jgi:hypothetical protein
MCPFPLENNIIPLFRELLDDVVLLSFLAARAATLAIMRHPERTTQSVGATE